jgi:hypothetical protein
MKRFLLFTFLFAFSFIVNAASKVWIGAPGGLWSDPNNWSPIGIPVAGDDITFNTNGTVTIDAAGPFAVNSLTFTNNSAVTFSTPGTRNFRFSSTSTINPALKIDAGSTFTFDASNAGANNSTLDLGFGAAGVIGSIYGTLNITSSGGVSAGIRLDTYTSVTNYAILTVYNDGIIRVGFNTNTTVSSLTPTPTFNMLNGSLYESLDNGGSIPTGNWEANSLARALSPGANSPQFNGTTYGNLEWNCPLQNNFSLGSDLTFNNVNLINTNAATSKVFRIINSGSIVRTLTINGDLTISSSSILEITGAGATAPGGGKLHLLGNLNNSGTILTTGVASTVNDFELDGVSNQNITNTGTFSGARMVFIMNNFAGATLLSPLTLPGNLTLTNGIIKTTSSTLLTMIDNATYAGGSMTSFINGPMKKIGDEGFIFPIGEGLEFARIEISNGGAGISTEFTAQYFRGNPRVVIGSPYETPAINHMSVKEWWTLDKNGVGTKNVKLYTRTFTDATLLTDLRVLRWDGSIWVNEGILTSSGTPGAGTVTSLLVSNFFAAGTPTPFTFGSVTSFENPLPITLISFDASKLSNTKSSINWELAACCSSIAKFEIQRAGADKHFVTIGTVGGSETNKLYNYIDNGLKNGINYYRLKMIDSDGKITYSRTVAVMNGVNGLLLTSLIPTIVTNNAALTIASSNQRKLDIIIVDMQGRVVLKRNFTIAEGNTNIELQLNGLAAGVYQLTGLSAEGKTNTIRFIKQ